MCYRTRLNTTISAIEKAFEAAFLEPESFSPKEEINAFDFLKTPVVVDHSPEEILMYNWGLVPFWAKNDQLKKNTLNAKIETVKQKPAFRDAEQNRCLIIANGFFEWQWLDPKGKQKQKYLITPKTEEIFAFAGIYSTWENPQTSSRRSGYSILTTEANDLMSQIHNHKKRMPVVLHPRDHRAWLEGRDVNHFAYPYEVELSAAKC